MPRYRFRPLFPDYAALLKTIPDSAALLAMAECAGYNPLVYDKIMRDAAAAMNAARDAVDWLPAHGEAVRLAVEPLDLTAMYPLVERVPDEASSKTPIGTSTADTEDPPARVDQIATVASHLDKGVPVARSSFTVYESPQTILAHLRRRLGGTYWGDDELSYSFSVGEVAGGIEITAVIGGRDASGLHVFPETMRGLRLALLRLYQRERGWWVEVDLPDAPSPIPPIQAALDWLRDAYNPPIAAAGPSSDAVANKTPVAADVSVESGVAPLPPALTPGFYSFDVPADLEAVVKALYAASHELPTVGLANGHIPTGGTITYGPLRTATGLDPRWVDERFDRFFELPSTITWRTGDEPMPYGLTYVGLRRLDDRRTAVRMIGLKRNQLSVMTDLLGRLQKDYPETPDQVDRQMYDFPMLLTPTTTDAAIKGGTEPTPPNATEPAANKRTGRPRMIPDYRTTFPKVYCELWRKNSERPSVYDLAVRLGLRSETIDDYIKRIRDDGITWPPATEDSG